MHGTVNSAFCNILVLHATPCLPEGRCFMLPQRALKLARAYTAGRVDSSAIGHYIPRFFEDALVAAPNNLCVFSFSFAYGV